MPTKVREYRYELPHPDLRFSDYQEAHYSLKP